jgi:hypothetical protein
VIAAIVDQRLRNQFLTRAGPPDPAAIVRWFGAVQAQEHGPAKWALGLRGRDGASDADVQQALDEGRIVRTHAMRPTWHFVAAEDCRWLLELTAPQVHKRMATYDRRIGLEPPVMRRGTKIVERALRDGRHLTRTELREHLARAGMALDPMRLAHLLLHAELARAICSGPRRAKQSTYALFDERVAASPRLSRDEAMAELARRYFQSHGPATIRDFVWWSGLSTPDAKRALDIWSGRLSSRPQLRSTEIDGLTYRSAAGSTTASPLRRRVLLLPIYDEYLVAYRDRVAVPHGANAMMSFRSRERFQYPHALVIDGQVAGTWRVRPAARSMSIEVVPYRRLTPRERRELNAAARRYAGFVGVDCRADVHPARR